MPPIKKLLLGGRKDIKQVKSWFSVAFVELLFALLTSDHSRSDTAQHFDVFSRLYHSNPLFTWNDFIRLQKPYWSFLGGASKEKRNKMQTSNAILKNMFVPGDPYLLNFQQPDILLILFSVKFTKGPFFFRKKQHFWPPDMGTYVCV